MFLTLVLCFLAQSSVKADLKDDRVTLDKEDLRILMNRMETFEKLAEQQAEQIEHLETELKKQKSIDVMHADKLANLTEQTVYPSNRH